MERKSFVTVLMLLFSTCVYAQVNITFIDADTREPIPGVIVTHGGGGWTADVEGVLAINEIGDSLKVNTSQVGYEQQSILLNNGEEYTVRLKRKYNTMNEVVIRAQRYSVAELLNMVAAHFPDNYARADKPVAGNMSLYLLGEQDTLLDVGRRVYYYKRTSEYTNNDYYDLYQSGMDRINWRADEASYEEISNNMAEVNIAPQSNMQRLFLGLANNAPAYYTVLSTFTERGREYYDIVLINKFPARVEYDFVLEVAGYGKQDAEYIALREIILDVENYAVTFMQQVAIESTEEHLKELLQLKNREDIRTWMNEAERQDRKKMLVKQVFDTIDGKYYPVKALFSDNLMKLAQHEDLEGTYTYIQETKFNGPIQALPSYADDLMLWQDVKARKMQLQTTR